MSNLIDSLKRDEGCVLHVYLDSEQIPTAGYGHNLKAHGLDLEVGTPITQELADNWLLQDCADASDEVDKHLPWARALDTARHDVLVNMAFNMGIIDLLGFHRALAMCQAKNYEGAASAMLESRWAKQVGARATRLARQMESGEFQ